MIRNYGLLGLFLFSLCILSFKQDCNACRKCLESTEQTSPRKRKLETEKNTDFNNLKKYKRSQDDQIKKLTVESLYVKGDDSARVRWVNDLDIYYGSKKPNKVVEVPATIHEKLNFVGNHLKACYQVSDTHPNASKRNILLPFVNFVVKRDNDPREFLEGGYLRFEENGNALAFISGPQAYSTETMYHQYAATYNLIAEELSLTGLPTIKMIAGNTAANLVHKNFNQINDQCTQRGKEIAYKFHTEEWFHEVLGAHPQLAVEPLERLLSPGDKVYAIIFDMYSLWDVCSHCQQKFKKELFQRKTISKIQNLLDGLDLNYPRNGLKVIFRVSSERDYFSHITNDQLEDAGGGYDEEEGFDIKTVDTAQVSLCTRYTPTYEQTLTNVKTFFKK